MSAEFEPWRCKHAVDDERLFCPPEGCSKEDGCARDRGAWPPPLRGALGPVIRAMDTTGTVAKADAKAERKRAKRRLEVRAVRQELALQEIAGIEHSFKAARIAREALHG